MKRLLVACVLTLAVCAMLAGSLAVSSTPAQAKATCGRCPLYCLEVICDNGKIYCNSCLAACAGAKNCTTIGAAR